MKRVRCRIAGDSMCSRWPRNNVTNVQNSLLLDPESRDMTNECSLQQLKHTKKDSKEVGVGTPALR